MSVPKKEKEVHQMNKKKGMRQMVAETKEFEKRRKKGADGGFEEGEVG